MFVKNIFTLQRIVLCEGDFGKVHPMEHTIKPIFDTT